MPPRGRMPKTGREGKILKRLLKDLWAHSGLLLIVAMICLMVQAGSNTMVSIFLKPITDNVVTPMIKGEQFAAKEDGTYTLYVASYNNGFVYYEEEDEQNVLNLGVNENVDTNQNFIIKINGENMDITNVELNQNDKFNSKKYVLDLKENDIVTILGSNYLKHYEIAGTNLKFAGTEFEVVKAELLRLILIMGIIYVIGIIGSLVYSQMMAVITQDFLNTMRKRTFTAMEKLPIKYFDINNNGDIMSVYTNDVDTIRQLVSQVVPQFIQSGVILAVVFVLMLVRSIWLMLVIILGLLAITLVTKKIGGKSSKNFVLQQRSIGKMEGFVEEMMAGGKVVKVFTHERKAKEDFDKINAELQKNSTNANLLANILGPIIGNIGNILYVLVSITGVLLVVSGAINVSITGISALTAGTIVAFLNMTRQFTMHTNQLTMQMNSIVMALAGAERVYNLIDEVPEFDEGYVTLVNAKYDENGELVECEERTGLWAWKHPHKAEGTITYQKLEGDIRLFDVDFAYVADKPVLKDITLYAKPGQKVAFVGATGAGKTTITNLINRFYDIADGKIRYDGININKIKKADLRRSLGMVLQDTNLFTGTVMENIRYGKLDATDEEVYEAAKIANAYDFITRLPEGFNTMLESDGANLSQGQRQLLSIARAAVANPPVMILDEATSSIDTRTEKLVQEGMDRLMQGRTVFVIAHRLSTVQNSDVIMVLSHGEIIERGSHAELIQKKGEYYQLYTGAFELE